MKPSGFACAALMSGLLGLAGCAEISKDCATATDAVLASALASESYAEGLVVFKQSDNSEQTSTIEVVHYRESDACRPSIADRYEHEGGDPHLEATFIHTVKGEPNLFSIVSWPLEHRALGMQGRLYSVYAYQWNGTDLELNNLVVQNPNLYGGVIGTNDGRPATFEGATQEGVISLLSRYGLE